jgi:hypothetical protein
MAIELLDMVHGIFTIVFVIISIITGFIIVIKYFQLRKSQFLLFGLFWMGLTTPWWPTVIIFILALATGTSVNIQAYIVVGIAFLPITITLGLIAFLKVLPMKKKRKRIILITNIIINAAYEIYFFAFLFIDVSMIADASVISPFMLNWSIPSQVYFIVSLLFFLYVGISFSVASIKAEDKIISLKGKFLLIAFLSFTIGTVVDFAIPTTIVFVIARLILLTSTIEFYIGLMLPNWIKELFMKS